MPLCSIVCHAAIDAPKFAVPVKYVMWAKLVRHSFPQKQWFYWPTPLHPEQSLENRVVEKEGGKRGGQRCTLYCSAKTLSPFLRSGAGGQLWCQRHHSVPYSAAVQCTKMSHPVYLTLLWYCTEMYYALCCHRCTKVCSACEEMWAKLVRHSFPQKQWFYWPTPLHPELGD